VLARTSEAGKVEYYRKRAAELRAVADGLQTAEAKELLRNIADNYERLALTLENQSKVS
jgi:hypothetical protein